MMAGPTQDIFYPELNYDCLPGCGLCCRQEWRIPVKDTEIRKLIEDSKSAAKVRKAGYLPLSVLGEEVQVGRKESGACVFLDDQTQLCGLHGEVGADNKPAPCRHFPFQPVSVAGRTFVGMSFRCPAVAANQGKAVSQHQQQVEAQVEYLEGKLGSDPQVEVELPLPNGQVLDWEGYLHLEERVRTALESQRPSEALWNIALQLVGGRQLPYSAATSFFLDYGLLLMAAVECPNTRTARQQASQAFSSGGKFYSERRHTDFEVPRNLALLPEWYAEEASRFFLHLVFRKELCETYLLGRLLMLILAVELTAFYTQLECHNAGREQVEREDLYAAFSVVESIVLLTHADFEPMVEMIQTNLLAQLSPSVELAAS